MPITTMEPKRIIWELPIKTVSEANCSEHWSKKAKRHKQQQFFVRTVFNHNSEPIQLPCIVTLTRLCCRFYDDDNNVSCFKKIRDEMSECLIPEKRGHYVTKKGKIKAIKGRADSDPRIEWKYKQEKNKNPGIRIEIAF